MKFKKSLININYLNESISLSYNSWGNEQNRKLFCVHGLTRNSNDFDYIANELSELYHVISIDLPGRGNSSWLKDYTNYNYQTYKYCLYQLIESFQVESLDWLGSSLGGILGMIIAAEKQNLIENLILNDIGPFVPFSSLSKISTYVNKYPLFINLEEAKNYLKKIIPNFGIRNEEDWNYITKNSFIKNDLGLYYQTYDPKLVQAFIEDHIDNIDLWEQWNKVLARILTLRGDRSNILLKETVELMKSSKAITLYELKETGHTPSLMNKYEIDLIKNWLLKKQNNSF